MRTISVGLAMTLLVLGNLSATFSDALVKTMEGGPDGAIFQFALFRQVSAVLILLPFCLTAPVKNLKKGLKWHALRAHIWLLGVFFSVIALTTMPLATANAIFYAAPLIMLSLAAIFLREKLSAPSIIAAVVGFIGVLILVRPTELDWGASSALIVAVTLAVNNLLIPKIPREQTVSQTLMLHNLIGIPIAFALALYEGMPFSLDLFWRAAGSTAFILVYAATCVIAYRAAESNKIASAEYSGLVCAVGVGLVLFGEVPDMIMIVGTTLIVVPLIWLAGREKHKARKAKKAASLAATLAANQKVTEEAIEPA
ncbi:DMT family transporter [Enterovibrio norvegicus]|uniref:DMT family transporter n=1 Tax=Enterovibrio norvegicus TaxID=188144 RepID=UPI0002DE2D2A|nr:DMT family transporter [Enterovibrio norvegicus]